ncbi:MULTISPECIES: hypothetical protein [Stenotrophomonas]|uniref:hypothetical protein n=1 Tax=Stenotrophomonas TaxID=40323 RepID=UPI00192E6BB2|nr:MULTISPECIES: hypothetical protein [Stenotrophomonas]HDS1146239.1 hypothetical protein [Stenotrophomonas maltophilia]HDS1161155.1 hypothetical protein [Stenotrophomonas maltophilia]
MPRPFPELPPIDVRRTYLACCAPSPWWLALVVASTTAWLLASQDPMPPVLTGFGAAALLWFRSDGPGRATGAGTAASLLLIGLAMVSATAHSSRATLQLLLATTALLVLALLALRLHAIAAMAARLQARVDAAPMARRWTHLPPALSTLMVQQLRGAGPLQPSLHRTLVLATLAWAANEEAQAMERRQ